MNPLVAFLVGFLSEVAIFFATAAILGPRKAIPLIGGCVCVAMFNQPWWASGVGAVLGHAIAVWLALTFWVN